MRLLSSILMVWSVGALVACSDDGVPAEEGTAATAGETAVDDDNDTNAGTDGDSQTTDGTAATTAMTQGSDTDIPGTDGSSGVGGSSGSSTDTDGTDTDGTSTGTGSSSGSGSSSTGGGLGIGETCEDDDECASGVCWDFSDYDKMCGGAVCSTTCKNTDECIEAFEEAGAPTPKGSTCGEDGRCDPVGTGFGDFVCAAK